jgi:hypothetical protein
MLAPVHKVRFLEYAVVYGVSHAQEPVTETFKHFVLDFLRNHAQVAFTGVLLSAWTMIDFGLGLLHDFSGIHMASYYDLRWALPHLLEDSASVSTVDSYGRTPLSCAAEKGHNNMVSMLLEWVDVVQLNWKDILGQTPLIWASGNGHDQVVRLLLERADIQVNSKDENGWRK